LTVVPVQPHTCTVALFYAKAVGARTTNLYSCDIKNMFRISCKI